MLIWFGLLSIGYRVGAGFVVLVCLRRSGVARATKSLSWHLKFREVKLLCSRPARCMLCLFKFSFHVDALLLLLCWYPVSAAVLLPLLHPRTCAPVLSSVFSPSFCGCQFSPRNRCIAARAASQCRCSSRCRPRRLASSLTSTRLCTE